MASDVMTLFNMPTQQELGQRYLDSQMVSPAQMGNQGLLQQVVSMGGNAGAGLGYAGGRLFGGATPDQVRAKGIDEAMRTVQGLGLTSDAEMYAALSKELGARGLTQDAFMANKEARTAMRDEQVVKKGGLDIETATLQLKKSQQDMLYLEQRLAQSTDPEEQKGIKRELEAKARASALVEAQIKTQEATAKANLINAGANASRVSNDKISGNLEVTYPNLPGSPPIRARIGAPLANGKIVGQGTGRQYTQDEWAAGGMTVEENAVKARLGIGQETTAADADKASKSKKEPEMSFVERFSQLLGGNKKQDGSASTVQEDNTPCDGVPN
jgi:hypothetical protein